jgi:lipopolysaccharide biosynthesis glycosyltransferase
MKSIKIRFNLGKGKNFMKWKVQYTDGTIEYHSPADVQLLMHDCTLKNHKKTAQKIFDGAKKLFVLGSCASHLQLKNRISYKQTCLEREFVTTLELRLTGC